MKRKTEHKSKHYVYIVCCSRGTYYTGYTNDLEKRMETHNSGKGAKYLRGRTPVELVYTEECKCLEDALQREHEIKKLTRRRKEELVKRNLKVEL
ncbi:MAG: GIY-YIG nuclease family protein [Candidatus Omnitrophica bacterium]|nr:GIY-YIG nuclease family protein [Candidatus Omnitrophota bacterium]